MQKALLIPLRFLIAFFVSAILMLFFCLIFNWAETVSIMDNSSGNLLKYLSEALCSIIFPAVSVSLLISFFSNQNSRAEIPAILITAIAVFLILFFGYGSLSQFDQEKPRIYKPLSSRTIQVTEDYLIYTDKVTENYNGNGFITNLIIKNRNVVSPGFRYYSAAEVSAAENPQLIINREKYLDIIPANPVFTETFKPDPVLGPVIRNIEYLGHVLRNAAAKGRKDQLFYTLVISAFLMSCMLIKGSGSWPLFDMMFILTLHMLVYYLFFLFSGEAAFISETFFDKSHTENIPLYTMTALTVIIFLFGVLVKLTRNRKKE